MTLRKAFINPYRSAQQFRFNNDLSSLVRITTLEFGLFFRTSILGFGYFFGLLFFWVWIFFRTTILGFGQHFTAPTMILKFRLVLGFGLLLSGSDFYLRVLTFNLGFGLLFEGPGHYFKAPTIIVSSDYYFRIRTTTLGLGLPF